MHCPCFLPAARVRVGGALSRTRGGTSPVLCAHGLVPAVRLHIASTCGLITHQECDHGQLQAKASSGAVRRTLFAQLRQGARKDHGESFPVPLTTVVVKRMLKPLHHGAPETGQGGAVRGTRTRPASPGVHILRSHLRAGFHATRQARAVGPSAGGPWRHSTRAAPPRIGASV